MSEPTPALLARAQDEVAELLSDLIRIDTTNTGDTASGKGERAAAEWVAGKLDEVGISSVVHESERGRASLVARIPGQDRSREALLVHGHLDVVPADPAGWSVHPFSGEVGGFSITVRDDLRLYLLQTAEKGLAWMRLTAGGKPGHGSFVHDDNAVTRLSEAVARIGAHRFPLTLTPPMKQFLAAIEDAYGVEIDPAEPELALARLGSISRMIGAALRNTVNPTMLDAGYKANVIPGTASATVDGRFLHGYEEEFERQLAGLIGEGVQREWLVHDQALEATVDGPLVDAMGPAPKAR